MLDLVLGYKDFVWNKPLILLRILQGIFCRRILNLSYLRVAEIATTFACDSKCIMCSCAKLCDVEQEKNKMTVAEYSDLNKQLDDLNCISVNITGGEPLIRDDIKDILTVFNPKTKIVNLITNGINLTSDKIRDYIKLRINSVVVSLESTNAEENDKIRGVPGHFQKVQQIITWSKTEKLPLGISLTLGDFNFAKVYELLRFVKDKKLFLCVAHGGSIGNWADNTSIQLSQTNAEKILGLIKEYKKMKIDFSANLSLRPGCPAIIEKIYITPYGDVLPCAFNPISFGNLREETLKQIWFRMIKFYRQHIKQPTLCLRTYNMDYINTFLNPLRKNPNPHRIFKYTELGIER